MVLQIKTGLNIVDDERNDKNDNFYLGPPDFSKIVPTRLNAYSSRRRVWLLSDRFAHQSSFHPVFPSPHREYDLQGIFSQCSRTCTTDVPAGPPFPTTREEKVEAFQKSMTSILSCIYAVFIVTLGIVIYVGELMTGNSPVAEFFSIYLVIVGLCYFAFLYVDMRRYFKTAHATDETFSDKYGGVTEKYTSSDREAISVHGSTLTEPLGLLAKPHHYCLSKGRHSESFYLKVGAAGFCLGHLIHSGLLISSQVAFLIFDSNNFYRCSNIASLILDVLYPTYSFFQLFIIFKYSNVIINKHKIIGRFALMHCIGSNLCFWVWTILRETVDSLYNEDIEYPASLHHVSVRNFNNYEFNQANATKSLLTLEKCNGPKQFKNVFETFSPYLYPFTIEYSILVVGVLFVIWQNIGSYNKCDQNAYCKRELISNVVLYADCHSSNKGLFAGLIVLAGSFLSIILFFVAMTDNKYIEVGLLVNSSTELILLLLMTITIIPAYRQITKLDINRRPVSLLDGLLLFTSIPAFFVLAILSFVPSLQSEKYLNMVAILLQLIQVLIQTPFIIDGLRRCSNSKSLRAEKPGRELLTFLIVCNVAMWITETFEIKSHSDGHDPRSAYFGKFLWSTITHLTFPLTMFYRFHSSVCMVDIWKSAYAKGE